MFERVLEKEVDWGGRTVITQVYCTAIMMFLKKMIGVHGCKGVKNNSKTLM
jgi:hypothetical protein